MTFFRISPLQSMATRCVIGSGVTTDRMGSAEGNGSGDPPGGDALGDREPVQKAGSGARRQHQQGGAMEIVVLAKTKGEAHGG